MVLSEEDKHMIKSLRQNKQYCARRYFTEFPNKISIRNGLDYLLKNIDTSVKRLTGSRRLRTACTADNVDGVEELVMRLENQPQTHRTILYIHFHSIAYF